VELEEAGIDLSVARDLGGAVVSMSVAFPDVIAVELSVPTAEAVEIALVLRFRSQRPELPIVVLGQSNGSPMEKVIALDRGADEFIGEPHDPREVAAIVRALVRRAPQPRPRPTLRLGRIELDSDRRHVRVDGRDVTLTAKEFELLEALLRSGGRVLTRQEILATVWQYAAPSAVRSRTLDVHVRSLRRKLAPDGLRIVTVRNVGFRVVP
jgi:DNA-binding response OmpR family regulator